MFLHSLAALEVDKLDKMLIVLALMDSKHPVLSCMEQLLCSMWMMLVAALKKKRKEKNAPGDLRPIRSAIQSSQMHNVQKSFFPHLQCLFTRSLIELFQTDGKSLSFKTSHLVKNEPAST